MVNIEVDFEVYKALTVRRASESTTYNDVIRSLLKLDVKAARSVMPGKNGATFKGVFFPDGTQFRATYKGQTYTAEIKNGSWAGSNGRRYRSPSEAAVEITGKNWNGWRFWHCKRPGDLAWQLIDKLRPAPTIDDLLKGM